MNTQAETGAADARRYDAAAATRQLWSWAACVALVVVLPWLFYNWGTGRHSSFVIVLLSEIGLMTIFALSFNMLMGQAGLLSFGHAVLFGLGGYCTAHALNSVKSGGFWIPTELVPLIGGLGGLAFGIVLGFLATKQRATAFAMITLGLGEMVTAAALMFIGFFGGEGGITTDRVIDTSLLGITYSKPLQLYYLVAAWMLMSIVLMRLQTQTPLGRMANATRDNFERAQFVGYDPRMVRFYQYALSGFFAGVGGGLYCMVYEIITFDTVGAVKSSTALLSTYIGGAGHFFGPVVGTILVVLLQSGVSLLSNAWLLYVGVLFIVMVMFAPGGLMGIVALHAPIARLGRLGELVVPYILVLVPGLVALSGFIGLVELTSLVTIGTAQGKRVVLFGHAVMPTTAPPWIVAGSLLVVGSLWLRWAGRGFRRRWNALIDDAKARGIVG